MAQITITIKGQKFDIEASNAQKAAGEMLKFMRTQPGDALQARLATAIAKSTGQRDSFVPFVTQRLECPLPDEWANFLRPLSPTLSHQKVEIVGGGGESICVYNRGPKAPTSEKMLEFLGSKILPADVKSKNLVLMTTGGEYQIESMLSKTVGKMGALFLVKRDGKSFIFKTSRANVGDAYEAELRALQHFSDCPGIVKLVEHCDALIILEKAEKDVESGKWKSDEVTVCKAFQPLAEALQRMMREGYWHDDLQGSNVLRFDNDVLKLCDIGGKKGNARDYQ